MKLLAVTYHYVRDPERGRFPGLKTCRVDELRAQLRFLAQYFRFVSVEEVADAVADRKALPQNAALLTFDDGLAEHGSVVLELLDEAHAKGLFAVVGRPLLERRFVTTHRLQCLLSEVPIERLVQDGLDLVDDQRRAAGLSPLDRDDVRRRFGRHSRWDPPEVAFFKSYLQKLDGELAERVSAALFQRHLGAEDALVDEIYCDREGLRRIVAAGHCLACHSYKHQHLTSLSDQQLASELDHSLTGFRDLRAELGVQGGPIAFVYPYGSHDDRVTRAVSERGVDLAFTVLPGLQSQDPVRIPRFDVNDLPRNHPLQEGRL